MFPKLFNFFLSNYFIDFIIMYNLYFIVQFCSYSKPVKMYSQNGCVVFLEQHESKKCIKMIHFLSTMLNFWYFFYWTINLVCQNKSTLCCFCEMNLITWCVRYDSFIINNTPILAVHTFQQSLTLDFFPIYTYTKNLQMLVLLL